MSARRRITLALALLCAAPVVLPRPSFAQCTYPVLGSGSSVYYSAGTVLYPYFAQSANYWSAVAIRPDAGSDWDLGVYQSTAAYPTCVTNQLASSALSGSQVDVIVGDFNHNSFGNYIVRPYVYAGTGNARIEWDDGSDQFPINAPRIQRTTGPTDVIECWDVFLEAGKFYSFDCRILGPANMKLLLFKNPAAATYWAGRNSAIYNIDLPPNSATLGGLIVDQSDWYGLVMVNENGAACDYQLQLESCASPQVPLASTVSVTAPEPDRRYSFLQQDSYFSAVGVRPNQPANYWSVWVGETVADIAPQCYQTHRASSIEADKVAYVVGDFNGGANATNTTYYARAYAPWGTGSSTGTVEWDAGPDQIAVGAPPLAGVTGPSEVLRCWDVPLLAGNRYRVTFTHGGAANLKLALFDNPGAMYWAPRSGARVESGTTFYVDVTRNDWYGLVLANDNGGAGTYEIGVDLCTTPIALAQDTPYLNIASTTNPRFALDVGNPLWAALGVQCTSASENWDLTLYSDQYGAPPHCFSSQRSTSVLGPGVVDVIAGRSNLGLGGASFFADPFPGLATSANGIFEWGQASGDIPVGGPPVTRAIAFDEVVHCWQVSLVAGTTYTVVFEREGNVNANLLLFSPTSLLAEGAWKNRSEADLATSGISTYTPAVSGNFGVVVVNDNGGIGNCRIGIYVQGGVAVGPVGPTPTRFEGIHPNPVDAGSRILFALAKRCELTFDVVNASGRRVTQLAAGTRDPGHGSIKWSGTDGDGRRLAAGVYFVRMRVDGQGVQDARLVLLP